MFTFLAGAIADTKIEAWAVPLALPAVPFLQPLAYDEDNPWVITGRRSGSHLTNFSLTNCSL